MCLHFEKKKKCFLRPFLDSVSTVYPDSDGGPELNAEMAKKRQKDLDRTCTVPILHTSYVSLLTTLLLLLGQKLDEVVRWLDAFHCTEKHKYTNPAASAGHMRVVSQNRRIQNVEGRRVSILVVAWERYVV